MSETVAPGPWKEDFDRPEKRSLRTKKDAIQALCISSVVRALPAHPSGIAAKRSLATSARMILSWYNTHTMSPPPEPRNPFYLLLLLVSLLFVMTALGYAIVPALEEKAIAAGRVVPESEFRDALRTDGWKWLLYQLAAMFVFGVLSMVLDRLRSLKKAAAENTISPGAEKTP
jgi:hypothetical protein